MLASSKLFMSIFVLFFGPIGCVSFDLAESPASSISQGFIAKKDYAVSYDSMWAAIRNVLDNERIAIVTSDKNEGRITTEYVKGEQKMTLGLFSSLTIEQHKYTISLDKKTSSVRVNIIATVEAQEAGSLNWRPLGASEKAKALEDWLYEKIEKSL